MEENSSLERIVNVPCSSCGGEMAYDPGKQQLLCGNCGSTRELPRANDKVVEISFEEAASLADQPQGYGVASKVFHCNSCGANTSVGPDQVSFNCPFCGSTNVNAEAHEARVIRPSGLLPFKVTKTAALEKFKVWIGKGFFAPSNLKRLAQLDKIRSVYLPFWTYDADTFSDWSAEAGYYYYTTESSTDSNGNVTERQVRHTRWEYVSGYHERDFDDVLVVGSTGLEQKFSEQIFPYELNEIVNYDGRFILGHDSEVYQKDVKEGFGVAEGIMDTQIRAEITRQVPGDTQRNLHIQTQKSAITFKHILLPIWIAAYMYNNKVYRFLVNGQTGKISGKRPTAAWKVILLILIILGIGVGCYFLFRGSGGSSN
jgi:predicted RNA-binding Zn-ribbon protein involved in translation (DUF1610 family)